MKKVLELCVGNKGERYTTHDNGQQQKALQHFVLRAAELVTVSIAGNRNLTAGVATTTSFDLLEFSS